MAGLARVLPGGPSSWTPQAASGAAEGAGPPSQEAASGGSFCSLGVSPRPQLAFLPPSAVTRHRCRWGRAEAVVGEDTLSARWSRRAASSGPLDAAPGRRHRHLAGAWAGAPALGGQGVLTTGTAGQGPTVHGDWPFSPGPGLGCRCWPGRGGDGLGADWLAPQGASAARRKGVGAGFGGQQQRGGGPLAQGQGNRICSPNPSSLPPPLTSGLPTSPAPVSPRPRLLFLPSSGGFWVPRRKSSCPALLQWSLSRGQSRGAAPRAEARPCRDRWGRGGRGLGPPAVQLALLQAPPDRSRRLQRCCPQLTLRLPRGEQG